LATRNGKSLVVVESPAKARTISRILGSDYDVRASIGHVRDLPERDLGVDVGNGFAPKYVVPKEKSRTIKEIKDAAKKASSIYLATDPDREGEAIAWHLLEAAGIVDADRVVFHEITPEAVQDAFRHPRSIDMNLVDAQQARRVLDRLVGYRLSPFLWRKVRKGLSAGRVQSVAVRLVAEREREILNFKPQEFWTIEATLEKERVPPAFRAKLSGVVGKKDKLEIPNETESERLVAALRSSTYAAEKVQTKAQTRRPAAPFITSTLQQEASRRLGFTTKKTMVVAQALYEGISVDGEGEVGLITYMRTDSTNIAASALAEAREFIAQKYGKDFLPASARAHTKKVKGAQEAHEAIRPTSVRREPDAIRRSLNNDQYRLYNLIWQRMVASQMADALFDQTTADVHATPSSGAAAYLLKATNTQLRFAGYRQVYIEGRDDDEEEDLGTNPLPELAAGDALKLNKLDPKQNFTEPPTRFTEASLIKALEEKGIGRPSTYAPTMSTIQDRGYVEKDGRFLKPSELGFVVNDLLVDHFPDFVDAGFTAQMEDELDDVAEGDRKWQPVVEQFYTPLEKRLEVAVKEAPKQVQETDEVCPESGHPSSVAPATPIAATRDQWRERRVARPPQYLFSKPMRSVPSANHRWSFAPAATAPSLPAADIPNARAQSLSPPAQAARRTAANWSSAAPAGAPSTAGLRQLPGLRLHRPQPPAPTALPQLRRPPHPGARQLREVHRLRLVRRRTRRSTRHRTGQSLSAARLA
jgi:DNA topoisomerase-1